HHLPGIGARSSPADRGSCDGFDDSGDALDLLGAGARHGDARAPRDEAVGLPGSGSRRKELMGELSLTILSETANDAQAIERLHDRTFGPGRFVLSAYRLREHIDHVLDLSFTARIGTLLVGSVRQLPVVIGETRALLLGPLTVEPPFRGRGVGRALLERALKDAK